MDNMYTASRSLRTEFDVLIKDDRAALWSYCLKLTGSPWDAEDLVQDSLLKAFAKLSYLYQVKNPKSYLFRIATNTWIDAKRKQKGVYHTALLPENEPITDPISPVELSEAIDYLIHLLPPKQHVCIVLIDVFEFQAKEVGAMLSLSEGAVRSLLHRARHTLRQSNFNDASLSIQKTEPNSSLLNAYVRAFNQRNIEGIVSLLHEDAVMEVVGVTEEYGRTMIRTNSLTDWAADPVTMNGTFYVDKNQRLFFVVTILDGEREAVNTIHEFTYNEKLIFQIRDYYYCPELLLEIGRLLEKPVIKNGYYWGDGHVRSL
ncbi:sigma-70 family RNA polymerase sigma factor [Alkalihalobacillus sp. LMS6]|uniref:sigma-70 family RNA polymerase sigma factor n=1 Tax=Bacillaceae TaxID=186817 RepID=UPI000C075304|nr:MULTISPECIES: sigma-70 family RNA polymerase sigma factor [Bacillaceae]UTR07203.1 sigma-70 family RNA polymerase sigma factor [Alkalihalobacillus sp. LMS6]